MKKEILNAVDFHTIHRKSFCLSLVPFKKTKIPSPRVLSLVKQNSAILLLLILSRCFLFSETKKKG